MERILRLMAERKASDIYLSANSPALIRINGNCMPINAQVLPPEAPLSLLGEVVHESRIAELERTGELNMAIALEGSGNFRISATEEYDRYRGVAELMPFARGVSAKSYGFDAAGNETTIDYPRMLKIVLGAGYHGHVGIEYEGDAHSEREGIALTQALLQRLQAELA